MKAGTPVAPITKLAHELNPHLELDTEQDGLHLTSEVAN